MDKDKDSFSETEKILVDNFTLSIRQNISELKQLLFNEDLNLDYAPVQEELQALIYLTLNNLVKWDYRLICYNFDIEFSQNERTIINEIVCKGVTFRGNRVDEMLWGHKVDILGVLCALENIYSQLRVNMPKKVCDNVKRIIERVHYKCIEHTDNKLFDDIELLRMELREAVKKNPPECAEEIRLEARIAEIESVRERIQKAKYLSYNDAY